MTCCYIIMNMHTVVYCKSPHSPSCCIKFTDENRPQKQNTKTKLLQNYSKSKIISQIIVNFHRRLKTVFFTLCYTCSRLDTILYIALHLIVLPYHSLCTTQSHCYLLGTIIADIENMYIFLVNKKFKKFFFFIQRCFFNSALLLCSVLLPIFFLLL